MGFYTNEVLPRLLDIACSTSPIIKQRSKVVPHARGRVLEVGVGTGHNLPLYDGQNVELVWALEPSHGMRARAGENERACPVEVRWLDLPGEKIPLADASVDTVVMTYTLCTIPDWHTALKQMLRVLKPDGRLLFCEHGAAPEAGVRRWQDRLDGTWARLLGGCHLNRAIPELLEAGGFVIDSLETMYLPGSPRFVGFNYWGEARKR